MRDTFMTHVNEKKGLSVMKCPTCSAPFCMFDCEYNVSKIDLYTDDNKLGAELDKLVGKWPCARCHQLIYRVDWEHHAALDCPEMQKKYGINSFLVKKHLEKKMFCRVCFPRGANLLEHNSIPTKTTGYDLAGSDSQAWSDFSSDDESYTNDQNR